MSASPKPSRYQVLLAKERVLDRLLQDVRGCSRSVDCIEHIPGLSGRVLITSKGEGTALVSICCDGQPLTHSTS